MDFTKLPPELLARLTQTNDLKLPPPVFVDMGGEVVDIDLDKPEVVLRFPVQERYENPMGYMQGGVIATIADNALGMLSFLVAFVNVTKEMNIRYVRPVKDISHVVATARMVSQDEKGLLLTADVRDEAGKLLARVKSQHVFLRGDVREGMNEK
ncbi:MAG: PaaI family thioesterase [Ardenticatenaceae bacterium]|nr:PaaI family thioesterase [Ardenticatenaceae bacterium]